VTSCRRAVWLRARRKTTNILLPGTAARGTVITVAGAALADYYALIAYAAATLDKNTAASRRLLYERARASLVTQMRKLDPPLTESEIRREQFALEEAIRKLEAEKLSRLAQRNDRLTSIGVTATCFSPQRGRN
jgi:hypothetical protein